MGFLVISRRIGERILVGDDIEILVSDISSGKVDIAIKADKTKAIKRLPTLIEANNVTEHHTRRRIQKDGTHIRRSEEKSVSNVDKTSP